MNELKLSEKKQFFSSIESLYTAGVPYSDIFETLEKSSLNVNIKKLSYALRVGVENGTALDRLIMNYKEIIGPTYALLLSSGIKAGRLEDSLQCIRKDIQRTENLRTRLFSSLTYPCLLFLGCIGVFVFAQSFFFPIFSTGFRVCPNSVMGMLVLSIFKVLLVYAGIFAAIFVVLTNKDLYKKVMNFLIGRTFLSYFIRSVSFINFFSVLGASYDAGIPVTEATESASTLFSDQKAILGLYKTVSILRNGGDVTSAFISAQIFNNFDMSQIATGEKTGRLGQAFKNIAAQYEKDLLTKLDIIPQFIQPAAIVLCGLIVGYIAIRFYTSFYAGILGGI